MELDKANSNDKSIDSSTTNEDVLVVLQTENGEQIALPMSALPSDFVPGDSGQIIMVESALDEQQQEIVVESSNINVTPEPTTETITQSPIPVTNEPPTTPVVKERKPKQKRKEPLVVRALDDDDMKLVFQMIEDFSPSTQEVDVRKRPRKEYRTKKKVKLALEKLSQADSSQTEPMDVELAEKEPEPRTREEHKSESKKEHVKEIKKETPRRELPKRGSKDREKEKDKRVETTPKAQTPQLSPHHTHQPQIERRTRLSNIYRAATGKTYKCNHCDLTH